jgi:hypothetical protein
MKRLAIALALAGLLGLSAFGQTLDQFKTAVSDFADAMAGTLALTSSTGSIWSDSTVGSFPNFGVGLSVGTAFTGSDAADKIFTALGQATPDAFKARGIPIPAMAATFKIGLPFIPADIGIKGMIIPQGVADSLKSLYNVSAQYASIGAAFRYNVVKERFWVPAVTLGAGANYQSGTLVYQASGTNSLTYGAYTVSYTNPAVKLGWTSLTFDTNVQVSKNILIFTPYLGAGLTFGKSTVDGGVDSTISVSGGTLAQLEAALIAAGEPDPFSGQTGFMYTATSTTPYVRLYGGVSLNILLVLDLQVMYVPATKALGGALTARIQL